MRAALAQVLHFHKVPLWRRLLSVWRSTNRQKLAFVKIGGQVRYRREDLDKFIADGLRNAQTA